MGQGAEEGGGWGKRGAGVKAGERRGDIKGDKRATERVQGDAVIPFLSPHSWPHCHLSLHLSCDIWFLGRRVRGRRRRMRVQTLSGAHLR